MSLAILADHMASKGRGPDSMLVHMSPREVSGLQALAQKHGGTLTINPETGLPEAGFLDKLLPTILGVGATILSGGTITPLMAGLGVGAIQAARTGDLGKGLMAGLGAYGGAGLAEGLMGAGASALTSEAAAQSAMSANAEAAAQLGAEANARDILMQRAAIGDVAASSPWEQLSAGAKSAFSSPTAAAEFAKANWKPAAAALSPIVADQMVKSSMPTTTTRPGQIRRFSYNPYDQYYTPLGAYDATPVSAASGGLMGLAGGGQFDWVGKGESVVRMADGGSSVGTAQNTQLTPNQQAVLDAYATIGRSGPGTDTTGDPSKISAGEYNYWVGELDKGNIALGDFGGKFNTAVDQYLQQHPDDPYSNYVNNYLNQQAVINAYGDIGRTEVGTAPGQIDQGGYDYWLDQLNTGAVSRGDFDKTFDTAVNQYLVQKPDDPYSNYVGDYVVNQYALPTGTAEEFLTGTRGVGLYDLALANALAKSKFSLGAQYALTHSDIGDPLNLEETYGGLKGVSSNINFGLDKYLSNPANAAKTGMEKRSDAWQSLTRWGLNEDDFVRATGKTIAEMFPDDMARKPVSVTPTGFYGNETNPGDITYNPDGTSTVQPNIPYRPEGGFSGMGEVRDAYTKGGGSLGYIPYAPKTIEEFNEKYNKLSGGSKQAYEHLMGVSPYSPTPWTPTGEVMKPYSEAVLGIPADNSSKKYLFDPATKTYKVNPDYIPVTYTSKGERITGLSTNDIKAQLPDMPTSDYEKWMVDNNVTYQQIADALGISLAEAKRRYPLTKAAEEAIVKTEVAESVGGDGTGGVGVGDSSDGGTGGADGGDGGDWATGGLLALARGGVSQFDLGGYSDGGRLLRGPGDGVSDSIPATIGNKRPARLADGEFVIPARIVSELGNGSTDAGARKLYAMMDRVQKARRKSTGKNKVAKDTRAAKYLPA